LVKYYSSYLSGLILGVATVFIIKSFDLRLSDFIITIIAIVPRFVVVFFIVDRYAYAGTDKRL